MHRFRLTAALAAAVLLAPLATAQLVATDAFPGVSFTFPVELAVAPGQPDRLYVVEQGEGGSTAQILTLEAGDTAPTLFLDLDDRVLAGGERGLLGLAFHPDYETNGRVFVYYTARPDGRTIVSEFARSTADPLAADPASEQVVLEVDQPFSNHNAGKIAFGPDGYLYVGLGDGGGANDPLRTGQDRSDLLGSLLRLDVDDVPKGETYGIPADNPFVGEADVREEIYAYGLRNPWKFSFDSDTGDLWLGDVGQNRWEEVNLVESGGNYGWRPVEGPACFESGCDLSAYDAPIAWYPHTGGAEGGFSITGGFVYRGRAVPGLEGAYLYADFVLPRLWMLQYDPETGDATSTLLTTSIPNISTINEGPGGEAYVASYNSGTIYILGGTVVAAEEGASEGAGLEVLGPNPVRGEVQLAVRVPGGESARITVLDALGREVARLHEGPAADTRLTFDASGLAPGLYFVHLDTPSRRATRRVVVSR
ncbi:MAG TPA: T9SS type A sorting domain-containing protein [Bacteroidetes bacterium]|nr:T9SS type A sorting domain-containing protein [Bacteroidota bacterium]